MKKPKAESGVEGRFFFAVLAGLVIFFFGYPFIQFFAVFLFIITFIITFILLRPSKKVKVSYNNEIAVISYVVEIQHTKDEKEIGREITRIRTYPRKVDFIEDLLIPRKSNRNITIAGRAGSGKTELIYYLIKQMPYKKIILQYKNSDRYRELGYPVLFLKDYVPNVFLNIEALVQAWVSAFVVENRGITASQLEPLVRTIAEKSRNWQEFKKTAEEMAKKNEGTITGNAVNDILLKLQSVYQEKMHAYPIPDELVIDFENLNANAFHFYAEWILRMLYEEIRAGTRKNTMIFIDEAKVFAESYNSIIPELSAIIRSRGAFLIATQRLNTIEGDIKANAGIQFSFAQTEPKDLNVASALSEPYHWILQRLQPYEFVDLAQADSHTGIYVYKLMNPKPLFKDSQVWKPKAEPKEAEKEKGDEKVDYEKVIIEILAQAGNIQDIAKKLAERFGGKGDVYRLKIKDIPRKMVKNGEINVELVDYVKFNEKQAFVVNRSGIYFRKNENPSGLHTYLVNMTADVLYHKGIKDFKIQPAGIGTADIESRRYAFEIETGLKNDINDIKGRIELYRKEGKETLIIVPNQETKKKYIEKYPDVKVFTIPELWEVDR